MKSRDRLHLKCLEGIQLHIQYSLLKEVKNKGMIPQYVQRRQSSLFNCTRENILYSPL